MFPLAFGHFGMFHIPLFGGDVLSRTAHSMAVSLCKPYRRSKRYHQMVAYYQWKLEARYERNLVYKGWACCHNAVVCWTIVYQLLRLLQLAEVIFTALK